MNNKPIEPIINKTAKALTAQHIAEPPKQKMQRAKAPKYDTGEKLWDKQIDAIIAGKKKTKKMRWPDD